MNALDRALSALGGRFCLLPPDCCPHPDLSPDADAAALPADTTHNDDRGSATNG